MKYCINYIYDKLAGGTEGGVIYEPNLDCQIVIVTPHCVGKYDYVDVDGYGEFPSGSGRTLHTLVNIMEDVAHHNSIPCYNAYENSGINRFTWCIYANSSVPESGKTEQGSGGPYYWNADQLHLNASKGYPHLGKCIARFIANL